LDIGIVENMLTRFVEVVFACLFLLQWCNDHIV